MGSTRYRVVQWATGNTGQRALREVIRHPRLDLVGVRVYDPEKDGVDAGELCGEARIGIAATTDSAAVFGLEADCVLYMPIAAGPPNARAGLTILEVLDDVVTLLESGTNIITTCTDFHAGGHPRLGEEGLARIHAACERGNSSVYASGTDPGLVTDIALAFLAAQRRVQCVEIIEYGDVSQRPSPHMIFDQMGFGKPLAEFSPEGWASYLHNEFVPSLSMLADAAGFTVEGSSARGEVAAARQDTSIAAGTIKAGTVAAQRFIIAVHSGGEEVVRLDQYAYVSKDVDPAWDIGDVGWRVRVNGDAPFDADLAFPVPPDKIGEFVPAYNANLPVNAIPYVCAAPPGILTPEDLPPIVPRGPRPKKRYERANAL
jgi:hypothetical protein